MEQIQVWDGYKGEFQKHNGGNRTAEEAMKAVAYALSQMASGSSNILATSDGGHEQALRIALARANPTAYKPRICKENLEVTGCIKNEVYKGTLKSLDKGTVEVAIKQQLDFWKISREDIWKTRDMLLHLENSRIEHLIGAFYDHGAFFVTELTLGSWDLLRRPVSLKNTLRFGLQLLEGLQWCHAHNIIHCVVNPDNCLIKSSGNLVLSNFKDAVILKEGYKAVRVKYLKGRPGYIDYESRRSYEVNNLSDVFAAACTIYKMETGKDLSDFSSLMLWRGYPSSHYHQQIGNSCFKDILEMMVAGREQRSDATDVLTDSKTKRLMKLYTLDFDKLDICTDPIQSDLNIDVGNAEFVKLEERNKTSAVLDLLAIGGIYHDARNGPSMNDLVAKEDELVGFINKHKQDAWLLTLVHPKLKRSLIRQAAQRKLGKRVPKGLKTVIAREAAKINLSS